uniref:Uncharacterized protein n=1 Tax=Cereibacter sphaeroides (strain ATCC 17025 / ATH 2.4.3) TaxID=349102 RepID=A4WS22_CERS5
MALASLLILHLAKLAEQEAKFIGIFRLDLDTDRRPRSLRGSGIGLQDQLAVVGEVYHGSPPPELGTGGDPQDRLQREHGARQTHGLADLRVIVRLDRLAGGDEQQRRDDHRRRRREDQRDEAQHGRLTPWRDRW